MKAIDLHYKHVDVTCQLDKEDGRFVLKGPAFNPIEILNVLTEQRGYKIEYNPQQHGIPLKQGNLDDKYEYLTRNLSRLSIQNAFLCRFALLYHLSKAKAKKCCSDTSSEKSAKGTTKSDPVPPPRTDSLPNQDEGEKLQSQMSKVDLT